MAAAAAADADGVFSCEAGLFRRHVPSQGDYLDPDGMAGPVLKPHVPHFQFAIGVRSAAAFRRHLRPHPSLLRHAGTQARFYALAT